MSIRTIQNPILRGFNPDPSILRVGRDFYIATSTFEWFPGVQIHHSRDLAHWRLLTRPLTRVSQLDLVGNADSGGVWAPCLSHDGEKFHLVYSDVKNWKGGWMGGHKECHNYLVTADSIEGPWSEPIPLNSSGFDPSLFHDTDGRKWLVNLLWDHRRTDGRAFAGIVLQEYSPGEQRLVGPIRKICEGTGLGYTEGPHLYRRGDWYYLMLAEGGTSYDHAVSTARSRSLEGPLRIRSRQPDLHVCRDVGKAAKGGPRLAGGAGRRAAVDRASLQPTVCGSVLCAGSGNGDPAVRVDGGWLAAAGSRREHAE